MVYGCYDGSNVDFVSSFLLVQEKVTHLIEEELSLLFYLYRVSQKYIVVRTFGLITE